MMCPYGYRYIHRDSEVSKAWKLEKEVEEKCVIPECEEPRPRGIAQCLEGRCVPGRSEAKETPLMSCWDARWTWLENEGLAIANIHETQVGTTPLLAMGIGAAGSLTIEVDWPNDCPGCQLKVSEHNSGMSRLVAGKRERVGTRETIELPAKEGPYYFLGMSERKTEGRLRLRATFRNGRGEALGATRHGVNWMRLCEG